MITLSIQNISFTRQHSVFNIIKIQESVPHIRSSRIGANLSSKFKHLIPTDAETGKNQTSISFFCLTMLNRNLKMKTRKTLVMCQTNCKHYHVFKYIHKHLNRQGKNELESGVHKFPHTVWVSPDKFHDCPSPVSPPPISEKFLDQNLPITKFQDFNSFLTKLPTLISA